MNLRLMICTFACVWLAAQVCIAEEPAYTGDVTDVRTIDSLPRHPGAARLWEPYIAQWEGKHLVAAFGVTIPGKTDMGDILASVSRDDGDTWADPVVIFDHNRWQGAIQFAYANAVLYKPPGQDVLWCFAMRCPMVYRNSEESQLVGAFSADGGRSWTPVEMAMHYTGPLIIVAGLCETQIDGQKRYLLPAHRNTLQKDPLGSRDQFVLSSSSLLEWKLEGYIPQPEAGKVFLHEGNIAPGDAPGELKMVMRTANYENDRLGTDPPRAFSSVSSDGGHTWSPARQEPDLYNAKSKGFYGCAADGTHLYVYNDGPVGQRAALRYKVQPPGGSWSQEKTFYDASIKNSYPTLVEVAPGDFRAVWDSGTTDSHRTHIHFGKLKLGTE